MFSALLCQNSKSLAELLTRLKAEAGRGVKATLVDARAVQSERQLQAAYELAMQSMKEGAAISSRLEIEFLLWLGQTTHVQKAIERVGVKEGKTDVVLVIFDGSSAEAVAKKIGLEIVKKQEMGGKGKLNAKEELLLLEQMALSRLND